ncbi:RUS family member 1 isoform X2 [Bacillus rossius redtenbacheri]|uniref:RUS family member 1 isoform X2 n=1 Tax=Bacillus rossius redtenbacheri TaxID=93214 RepID=UPI002FDD5CC6
MAEEILVREQYGLLGKEKIYSKHLDRDSIVELVTGVQPFYGCGGIIKNFFREVFLPQGYPDSVSKDYLAYQIWDTIQAFCSTLMGTLTTHSIMKGVGVGDTAATPLAAAVTWIMKDGTGMVSRIMFAWWKGTCLDADCKKWRLVADGLNDAALCLEMCLPLVTEHSTALLCASTAVKAVVGVAGGATRAAVTQHQAIRNNMGDVSAKDGSQETLVNLCASLTGITILSTVVPDGMHAWMLFVFFAVSHLFANYMAVHALQMTSLNEERLLLLLKTFILTKIAATPRGVQFKEAVILGTGQSVPCSTEMESS